MKKILSVATAVLVFMLVFTASAFAATTPGDVNDDGSIGTVDLVMMAQSISGWNITVNQKAADVNADGKVSVIDAVMMAQFLAGWDVILKESPLPDPNAPESIPAEGTHDRFTWTFDESTGALVITYNSTWEGPGNGDIEDTFGGCLDDVKSLSIESASCIQTTAGFGSFKKLETVTLCATLSQLRDNAFNGCTSLKTVNILSSAPTLGKYAFANTAITEITLPAGAGPYNSADPATIFEGCKDITGSDVTVYTTINSNCWQAFDGVEGIVLVDPDAPVTSGYVMVYSTYDSSNADNCVLNDGTENDLRWAFDEETGVLTISGTSTELKTNPEIGTSPTTWGIINQPWEDYSDAIKKLVVEAPIEKISGSYIFKSLSNLETIVLPGTAIDIGTGYEIFNSGAKLTKICTLENENEIPVSTYDLRTLTGSGVNVFKSSAINCEITVLLSEENDAPFKNDSSAYRSFERMTKVTFVCMPGSAGETFADTMVEYDGTKFFKEYYEGSEAPEDPDYMETKTTTVMAGTPLVDGKLDAVWEDAVAVDFPYDKKDASEETLAGLYDYGIGEMHWAKTLWDNDNLYVYFRVFDSNINVDTSIASYNRDGVEVYIDEYNDKATSTADCQRFFMMQVNPTGDSNAISNGASYVGEYATLIADGYYDVELSIPFEKEMNTGDVIGIDFGINGNDTGTNTREYSLSWNDRTNYNWCKPIYLGEGVLEGDPEPPVDTSKHPGDCSCSECEKGWSPVFP